MWTTFIVSCILVTDIMVSNIFNLFKPLYLSIAITGIAMKSILNTEGNPHFNHYYITPLGYNDWQHGALEFPKKQADQHFSSNKRLFDITL